MFFLVSVEFHSGFYRFFQCCCFFCLYLFGAFMEDYLFIYKLWSFLFLKGWFFEGFNSLTLFFSRGSRCFFCLALLFGAF